MILRSHPVQEEICKANQPTHLDWHADKSAAAGWKLQNGGDSGLVETLSGLREPLSSVRTQTLQDGYLHTKRRNRQPG